jgi:hypothetical protein
VDLGPGWRVLGLDLSKHLLHIPVRLGDYDGTALEADSPRVLLAGRVT